MKGNYNLQQLKIFLYLKEILRNFAVNCKKNNMRIISYISIIAVPTTILIILLYGIFERKNVFDIFLKGANDGVKMVIKIFPTLVGLFLAIGALSSSGVLDFIINLIKPILNIAKIPAEIMPLAILRPISGSGSIAVATDLMKKFGVDSLIGLMVGTIMGSTETTLYTIAVYTSSVNIKKIRFVLFAALAADITGMIASVVIWKIFFENF